MAKKYRCPQCGQESEHVFSGLRETTVECPLHGVVSIKTEQRPLGTMPIENLVSCAARELKMRESVYPRLVQNGKMTSFEADTETRLMKEILDNLKAQAPKDSVQPSLFGG